MISRIMRLSIVPQWKADMQWRSNESNDDERIFNGLFDQFNQKRFVSSESQNLGNVFGRQNHKIFHIDPMTRPNLPFQEQATLDDEKPRHVFVRPIVDDEDQFPRINNEWSSIADTEEENVSYWMSMDEDVQCQTSYDQCCKKMHRNDCWIANKTQTPLGMKCDEGRERTSSLIN